MSENPQSDAPREVEEEVAGYGTPTVEQEMGGQKAAQPRDDGADAGADTGISEVSEDELDDDDLVQSSADAEIDEGNSEERPPGVPFSSEPDA